MPLALLERLEASSLAILVRDSLPITALLSGLHLVGMTFVVGSALVAALQLVNHHRSDVVLPAPLGRVMLFAFSVSLVSGVLMALPRAGNVVSNPTFRWKMTALFGALLAFGAMRALRVGTASRVVSAGHFLLWGAVAVFGAMFTLLE